ncbi:MAG: KTSC domain-containing protein [Cyclobacteriaceae bacterium]|nr:KTSC domain-containing protein [Cyclobacteriaceae bacterium]
MKAVLIFFLLVIVNISLLAGSDNCAASSASWKSEKEAIDALEKADFHFSESFKNPSESWLISASFYSCDGQSGYLVIHSQKKDIIHSSVPMIVWQDLKNANSKGGFYNFYIRDKYAFKH